MEEGSLITVLQGQNTHDAYTACPFKSHKLLILIRFFPYFYKKEAMPSLIHRFPGKDQSLTVIQNIHSYRGQIVFSLRTVKSSGGLVGWLDEGWGLGFALLSAPPPVSIRVIRPPLKSCQRKIMASL